MRFLFDGKLAPLTNKFGFVKADLDEAVKAFCSWKTLVNGTVEYLETDFRTALMMLPPFLYSTRFLLFRTNSEWIGYVDNGGTDTGKARNIARLLKSDAVHMTAEPQTVFSKSNPWSFCELIYDTWITDKSRSIYLHYDGSWAFSLGGEPLAFEQLHRYDAKRKADRFNPEILDEYGQQMEIDFFNEDFYLGGKGNLVLITDNRALYDNEKPVSFEERRKMYIPTSPIAKQADETEYEDEDVEKFPFYLENYLLELKSIDEQSTQVFYQLQDNDQTNQFEIFFQGEKHEDKIGWQQDQPPKIMAKSLATGEQVVLFDGMVHGYDACIAGFFIKRERIEQNLDLYKTQNSDTQFEVFVHFQYDDEVTGDDELLQEMMRVNEPWFQKHAITSPTQMASCGFTFITLVLKSANGDFFVLLEEETA